MNKDAVIRMAREAGWDEHHCYFDTRIERFAALAFAAGAAHEREECAKMIDEWALNFGIGKAIAYDIRARGQE